VLFCLCGNRRLFGERGDGHDDDEDSVEVLVFSFKYEPSDRCCEDDAVELSLDSDETKEVESEMLSAEDNDSVERDDIDAESCNSTSDCASVYLEVVISSSRGVRKDTFFLAGNLGLLVIFLDSIRGMGLLANTELRT